MRELAVLPPALGRRYVALVAAVAPQVESRLSPSVRANRVARSSTCPPALCLAPWRAERAAFAEALERLGHTSGGLVFADVRDCYGSVAPDSVERALARLGCDRGAAGRVGEFLWQLAEGGVRGLPVGPVPSAVLANAVLAGVDDALDGAGVRHLRWVDDVVAAAEGPAEADVILEILSGSLASVGLELNASKTRVVAGPRAAAPTVSGACAGSVLD